MEVCVDGKCRPEDRQCRATGISRLQRWWYASILPPYAASAAGSFQAVTPLPPQAPEEESRPSTPRYGFAVFIPARHRRSWGVLGLTAASLLPSIRPRPRRESARPQHRSLPLFQGALRLPSTALQSPPSLTLPDTLWGHAPLASLVPRPWSLGDSKPGSRPDLIKKGNEITRIADPP